MPTVRVEIPTQAGSEVLEATFDAPSWSPRIDIGTGRLVSHCLTHGPRVGVFLPNQWNTGNMGNDQLNNVPGIIPNQVREAHELWHDLDYSNRDYRPGVDGGHPRAIMTVRLAWEDRPFGYLGGNARPPNNDWKSALAMLRVARGDPERTDGVTADPEIDSLYTEAAVNLHGEMSRYGWLGGGVPFGAYVLRLGHEPEQWYGHTFRHQPTLIDNQQLRDYADQHGDELADLVANTGNRAPLYAAAFRASAKYFVDPPAGAQGIEDVVACDMNVATPSAAADGDETDADEPWPDDAWPGNDWCHQFSIDAYIRSKRWAEILPFMETAYARARDLNVGFGIHEMGVFLNYDDARPRQLAVSDVVAEADGRQAYEWIDNHKISSWTFWAPNKYIPPAGGPGSGTFRPEPWFHAPTHPTRFWDLLIELLG